MDTTRLPPVIYAPTIREDDTTRIRMHRMADGRIALFVYSAIDRLAAQYGDGHPWVLISVPDLQRAHEASPFDLLLLDRELYPSGAPEAAHG